MAKKRKIRLKKWVYQLSFALSLIILSFSLAGILSWYTDKNKIEKLSKSITEKITVEEKVPEQQTTVNINPPEENKPNDYWDYIKMELISVDFSELLKKNADTVGWIKVNGTNINYPFVQTTDNTYYLNHAYDHSKNDAGWIFSDYRNNMNNLNKNTIIYGHGRYDTTMFGSLKNILNSNWYNNKDNHIIKISTPTENTLWQVFSVYSIKAESYYITTKFSTDEKYETFLNTLKERSVVDFSADININDHILTLSTCKDNFGQRIVMHAKLIKKETRA